MLRLNKAAVWVAARVRSLLSLLFRPLGALFDGLLGGLDRVYPKVLRGALSARPLVVLLAALAFGGAVWLVPTLGLDLIPTLSQGEFSFRVELPEGTPLEATDRFLNDVQAVLDGDATVNGEPVESAAFWRE